MGQPTDKGPKGGDVGQAPKVGDPRAMNTLYRKPENGERRIVLCGKSTHIPAYHHILPSDPHEPTTERCDRCVREGRRIAEA